MPDGTDDNENQTNKETKNIKVKISVMIHMH
jgi:hypothetical protein